MLRFNTPPNWPTPPSPNWMPTAAWRPPVNWPSAPAGWQFWVDDTIALNEQKRQAKVAKAETKVAKGVAKTDAKTKKAEDKQARYNEKHAKEIFELETYGVEIFSGTIGTHAVKIYSNGYVRHGFLFATSAHERLHSVSANVNVRQKNQLGRLVGGIVTQGWSLDTSDLVGSIYVTLVTDSGAIVLNTNSPRPADVKVAYKLEAMGNNVIA